MGVHGSFRKLGVPYFGPGCFFFLWPLFARAPHHWFLENFLLSAPGVQSVFFVCCAPLGAATFRRGQSKKKNTTQGVFAQRGFSFPCRSRGRSKKKHPGWGFSFCSGPVPAPNGASPSLAFRRGRSKKKKNGVFFFALAPCRRPTGLLLPVPFAGAAAKKNTLGGVFFLLRPRADAHSLTAGLGDDASPSAGWFFFLLRPRPDRGGVFFLLWPRPDAHSLTVGWGDFGKARVVLFFLLRPRRVFLDNNTKCPGYYIGSKKTRRGHSKKKITTSSRPGQGVFFLLWPLFARAPRHWFPGWRCLPLGGVVFFFCCGPARTGVVFFFLLWPRPDAHSLTVGWGDFGKARVVFFFFLLRPRRVFLDNNKKCLGYYIGSKKTRRGHSKKKHHFPYFGVSFQGQLDCSRV